MELVEDIKGLTAGVSSRKRGKRRYFWEYSEQLTPSKQERMLKPSEWDRHTLPSNLYQKNGPLHGESSSPPAPRSALAASDPWFICSSCYMNKAGFQWAILFGVHFE
jgi:hypothetical protein